MKKILLTIFLVVLTITLCSCKSQYKKYQDEILNKLPLQVVENIKLPLITDDNKYVIRWTSSNPEILNVLGVYKKPEKSTQIELQYKLVENNEVVFESYIRLVAVGYMPE